ncbi:hypothetical protein SNEBB_003630 [Seison nebaliae]|nr:hypothetical protein SNEBB_003630 [Seison nebaliae]
MPDSKNDNVRVVVRCRPMNKMESEKHYPEVVSVDENRNVIMVQQNANGESNHKTFTFDNTFGPQSQQLSIYNLVARPIVVDTVNGYNGTIFAYGQTGTGKTFTMEGDRSKPELRGIIPNSFVHLFKEIEAANETEKFLVRVSYFEIYNEEIRDLFTKNTKALEIKESPDKGVYVKDLMEKTAEHVKGLEDVMQEGNKNRSVGRTNMNETSSRSHAIFGIKVERGKYSSGELQANRIGRLYLVDLAGSERQTKTGATGTRLTEATKINLSLSNLGNVISALVDGKSSHIPYRNSKLTRILQDALGGNSKTVMCANVGPASFNLDETMSTLRYAHRAKSIQNHAQINEDPKDALLRKYQDEIKELQNQLAAAGGDIGSGDVMQKSFDDDDESDDGDEHVHKGKGRKKSKKAKPLVIKEMKTDEQRKKIEEKLIATESDKSAVAVKLREKEKAIQKAKSKLDNRQKLLSQLFIDGGRKLMKKEKEQAKLIEEKNEQLARFRGRQEKLKEELKKKEEEKKTATKKFSSVREKIEEKKQRAKTLYNQYKELKDQYEDLKKDHDRERDDLRDSLTQILKDIGQKKLLIDTYIPTEYQDSIIERSSYHEESGEWQIKYIAYTGKNYKEVENETTSKEQDEGFHDWSGLYHTYVDSNKKNEEFLGAILAKPSNGSSNDSNTEDSNEYY